MLLPLLSQVWSNLAKLTVLQATFATYKDSTLQASEPPQDPLRLRTLPTPSERIDVWALQKDKGSEMAELAWIQML